MEKTIIMKTFHGTTLKEVDQKFRDWKSFVNDENHYSIIEQNMIVGKCEYMLIVRFYKA